MTSAFFLMKRRKEKSNNLLTRKRTKKLKMNSMRPEHRQKSTNLTLKGKKNLDNKGVGLMNYD